MDSLKIDLVYFEITNKCNYNCKHCQNNSNINEPRKLKIKDIQRTVDDLKKCGTKTIVISGGEPSVCEEFDEIVKMICRKGFNVNIISNGYRLNQHITTLTKYNNQLSVSISLDGYDKESYHSIRNNWRFNSVVSNIKLMKDNGIEIRIKSTLTRDNYKLYTKFIEMAKSLNSPIKFNFLNPVGRGKKLISSCLTFYEIKKFITDLNEVDKHCFPELKSFIPKKCSVISSDNELKGIKINCDGDVFACLGFREKEYSMGNINSDSIINIIRNKAELQKKIRNYFNDVSNCDKCNYRKDCSKVCIMYCKYVQNLLKVDDENNGIYKKS